MASKITAQGNSRPTLSDLNKHVVPYLPGKKWEDLAYRLLQEDHTYHISNISNENKPKGVRECAKEMLQLWLSLDCPDTTWNKLISALKETPVELRHLAQQIEDKKLPGESRPKPNELYEHVVPYLGKKWKDLAYCLLPDDNTHDISQITDECSRTKDVAECAKEMLELWLGMDYPDITWNKLISELKEKPVELRHLAQQIEDKMSPTTDTVETSEIEDLFLSPESLPRNPSSQGAKTEDNIPKENLLYTVQDLAKEVKDSLDKFDNNILNEQTDNKIIDGVLLLLMVVNSSEFLAAMYYFSKNEAKVLNSGGNIYYVGKWGQIPAALVRQNAQGTAGPNGAQQITCSSINLFKNLKVIIALGVCGTMGRLGDVIISSRIDGCNLCKVKGDQLINRADRSPPGKNIHKFLFFNHEIWSFQCTKPATGDYKAVAVFKPMLSGAPLIASGDYRDKLKDSVSQEAGGLEMEGIGVIDGINIANKENKIEFIIVKAGCDYADESKNKEWQPVAAMAAADFVYNQLDKKIFHEWILGNQDDSLNTLDENTPPS